MPTSRFFALAEDKRRRIVKCCEEELNRVCFDAVSINRIVKNAGISRGSFYTYFTGKEDLIGYILQQYRLMMEDCICDVLKRHEGEMFGAAQECFSVLLKMFDESRCRVLFQNLFQSLRLCGGGLCFLFGGDDGERLLEKVSVMVDWSGYTFCAVQRSRILELFAVELRYHLVKALLLGKKEAMQASYQDKLEILKRGLESWKK